MTSGAAAAMQRRTTAIVSVAVLIAPVHIILALPCGEQKRHNPIKMRDWELVADKLSKAGWTWGCVATVDAHGRAISVADAHRGDGKRYVVHADEKLAAFLELERITHELAVSTLFGDDSN
jgi:hypothetical protein